MEKTKIGLPVGIAAALAFVLFQYAGYVIAFAYMAYILAFESDLWLKRSVTKAAVICIVFSLLGSALGLLPSFLEMIRSIVNLFDGYFPMDVVYSIDSLLSNILSLAKLILMLYMAFLALKNKTIPCKYIDNLFE